MKKPKAVLISDIHFTVPTLDLASTSLILALKSAQYLQVPLIIAGDTLDSKSIIRAEVANRLIDIFREAKNDDIYMLVGNHDLLNEKSENHSLEFLTPYINIVDKPNYDLDLTLIPYCSDSEYFCDIVKTSPQNFPIICHQGLQGADLGHYVTDKSGIDPTKVRGYRIVSGHYHKRQDIVCGRVETGMTGVWSYIGNPYTLTFGEADHPSKGYQILMDDGTLEHVPLDSLRKHIVIKQEITATSPLRPSGLSVRPDDLVWVKLEGPESILNSLTKENIKKILGLTQGFKLDKRDPNPRVKELIIVDDKLSYPNLFDRLIDSINDSDEYKASLKEFWKQVLYAAEKT